MAFGSLALGFMFQTLATYDFRNNGNETLKVARLDFLGRITPKLSIVQPCPNRGSEERYKVT